MPTPITERDREFVQQIHHLICCSRLHPNGDDQEEAAQRVADRIADAIFVYTQSRAPEYSEAEMQATRPLC